MVPPGVKITFVWGRSLPEELLYLGSSDGAPACWRKVLLSLSGIRPIRAVLTTDDFFVFSDEEERLRARFEELGLRSSNMAVRDTTTKRSYTRKETLISYIPI
jgi:hypothetical protein